MQRTPNIYFVTGTDTGIGKTVVTAAVVAALRAGGVNALPAKPVQTGCEADDDIGWILQHIENGDSVPDQGTLTCCRFPLAASPHLAAREAGDEISIERIVRWAAELASRCDVLVAEGAGGLLAPLNDEATMLDLINALNARPILVTANRLGTLNHTALTLNEMRRNERPPALVVINEINAPEDKRLQEDNIARIERMAGDIPTIACSVIDAASPAALTELGHRALNALNA